MNGQCFDFFKVDTILSIVTFCPVTDGRGKKFAALFTHRWFYSTWYNYFCGSRDR